MQLDPERLGYCDPGRYSFGAASQSGHMLHHPAWLSLLTCPATLCVLHAILPEGFSYSGGGGDFVRAGTGNYQALHSALGPGRVPPEYRSDRAPPKITINFVLQLASPENGPMRVIPGKKVINGQQDFPPKFADELEEHLQSKLCPLPVGAAILRDSRLWHGGTPNLHGETFFLPSVEVFSAKYASFIAGPHSSRGWCPACQWHLCSIPSKDRRCCLPETLFLKLPQEVQACCLPIRGPDAEVPTGFREFAHLRRSWEVRPSKFSAPDSKTWDSWKQSKESASSTSRPARTSSDDSWSRNGALGRWRSWRRADWNRPWSETKNSQDMRRTSVRSGSGEAGPINADTQPANVRDTVTAFAAVVAKSARVTLGLVALYQAVQLWASFLTVSEKLAVIIGRATLRSLPASLLGILGRLAFLRRL